METPKGNRFFQALRFAFRHAVHAVFAFLILFAIYGMNRLQSSNYFPIHTVRIIGLNHLAKNEIQETLEPLVKRGFFAIDVENIRDRLQQLPWAADVTVRRTWPDHIDITVTEKTAIARWNKDSLLSSDGNLFDPKESSYPDNLAEFVGPDGQQINMLKYFVNINRILIPLHAKISYLELTPYLTWMMQLDNGMTLKVGHNDILTRMTHFVKVYPKIVGERAADVEYIDLRYPNGMAVKWKNAG